MNVMVGFYSLEKLETWQCTAKKVVNPASTRGLGKTCIVGCFSDLFVFYLGVQMQV